MRSSHTIYFVIQRPGSLSAAFFDVRTGSWRRCIQSACGFLTRDRANAYALEWCLEGQAVVAPWRKIEFEKPERLQHDEPMEGPDYP